MMRSLRCWVVLAGAAWLVAGCGGGGGDGPTPPTQPVNRAPTISAPASTSVLAGREIVVRPTVSDPDGQSLTYSIANMPAWASFNATNGELRGTPAAADIGTYSNIRITVSDGQAQATATLSITVAAATAGTASVSWDAPLQRTDGSPLTNLAGFRIYYGNSSGDLRYVISVNDPGARSTIVQDLTSGTWYFAATAIDAAGIESARSNVASKTIS